MSKPWTMDDTVQLAVVCVIANAAAAASVAMWMAVFSYARSPDPVCFCESLPAEECP